MPSIQEDLMKVLSRLRILINQTPSMYRRILFIIVAIAVVNGPILTVQAANSSDPHSCPENKYRKASQVLAAKTAREIRKDERNDKAINRNFARLEKAGKMTDAHRSLLDKWNTFEAESHQRAQDMVKTFDLAVDGFCSLHFDVFINGIASFADQGLAYNARGIEFFAWAEGNWTGLHSFIPKFQQRIFLRDMKRFRDHRAESDGVFQELKEGAAADKQRWEEKLQAG